MPNINPTLEATTKSLVIEYPIIIVTSIIVADSFLVLFIIILLGSKAGSIHWTIYILSTISLSLTQPAVALAFPKHLAGKAFTSYNLILFIGIFLKGFC